MYYRCHTPQTSNLLQCSGCCHCQPSKKIGSKTEASQIATTAPNHSIGDKKRSWRLGDIVNSQPKPMCLCFDSGFKAFLILYVHLTGIYRRSTFKIRPNILIGLQKLRLRPKDRSRSRLFIYWNFLRRFSFVYPTSTIQQNSKQP